MGKMRWDLVGLGVVLLAILLVRMALSNEAASLSYDSYLTVRDVEHIRQTGLPLRDDPLSITGGHRTSNPVFDYLLAGAVSLTPMAYKLLPNLFMVLLLLPLYFLTLQVTQSKPAGFAAVVLAGTGPLVFSSYLNTPSSAPIAMFLLLSIIAMLHDTDRFLFSIIIAAILLTFLSPLIFLLVGALLSIVVLLRIEGFGVDRRINELFLFSLILSLWFYVIIFKQALFSQGIQVVWQNLPTEFAALTFRNVTFLDTVTGLGVITFLLGAIGVYHALFETRERSSYAVVGAIFAIIAALLLRLVSVQLGLLLLTLPLAVMAGLGLLVSIRYLQRTKAPWVVYPFVGIVIVLFLFSAVLPALVNARTAVQDSPTQSDIESFRQLQRELAPNAVLLTPIKEAAAVQYYADRTTLTDSDFITVRDGDELVADIDAVYTSRFSAPVINRARSRGFTDVLFTRLASIQYSRDRIYSEGQCLVARPVGTMTLYHVACEASP